MSLSQTGSDIVREDLEFICSALGEDYPAIKGKTVLITGGAGFLGYYLIKTLLAFNRTASFSDQIRVVVYDNFIRGIPDWFQSLEEESHVEIDARDITQPLPHDLVPVDYIIHAATIASPPLYRKYPIQTMDATVQGLRNILDYSVRRKESGKPVEGILFFSTSEIYGEPTSEKIPTPEDFTGRVSCTGPRACYDESKRYGETLCINFAREYGLPIRMVRPFNNYGPGLKITDQRVIPDFAGDILNGRDIVLLSSGAPTRTFCYIADAIIGYYKVLLRGRDGEPYNIGTSEPEITMKELADRMIRQARELFDYQGKVVRRVSEDDNYLVGNPNRRCPDITKARTELGFNPVMDLDEGLRRALCWYYENFQEEGRVE
ncbi:MAG: NAD-dependent epimerase/dehydratase family protein [Verrucomicrobiae bacterium]|nr:NAD-dependent epimerase/dehydratase family protein [Verrucomicrobiae bacterium]